MAAVTAEDGGTPGATAPWHHRLCGRLAAGLLHGIAAIPSPIAYALADLTAVGVAAVAFCSDRRGRRSGGVHRNLRVVLREQRAAKQHRFLLWRWARHMTHLTVDVCRMKHLTKANLERTVDMTDLAKLDGLRRSESGAPPRSFIAATGHIGVGDMTAYVTAVAGLDITGIYAESPMQPVTDVVVRHRERSGQQVLSKDGALTQVRHVLKQGRVLGLACDVSAKRNSTFAPFLGTLAATNLTPALLHRGAKAPIAVVTCQRVRRGRFAFRVWDIIHPEPHDDKDAYLRHVTARINDGLSQAILAYPEQWWWHGRRFRHRPAEETPASDGLPPPCTAPTSPRFW